MMSLFATLIITNWEINPNYNIIKINQDSNLRACIAVNVIRVISGQAVLIFMGKYGLRTLNF